MDVALVLQGGGALGAYEYGAISWLVKQGVHPKIVTGVSIGAFNLAAIAGAKNGDIETSLKELWEHITLDIPHYIPNQYHKSMAIFGNPAYYLGRLDWWNHQNWISVYNTKPIYETLDKVVDWDRLNDTNNMRVCVTAVNVATGCLTSFSNLSTRLEAKHIIASGSLPPGFPATEINGEHYWDGGLFDNSPLPPLLEMMTEEEAKSLPIIMIDLVPSAEAIPVDLNQVQNRMIELTFENRFWDEHGGHPGLVKHSNTLEVIDSLVPYDHPIRSEAEYRRLMSYRAAKNIKLITPAHQTMSECFDFSKAGIASRYQAGVSAARRFLQEEQFAAEAATRR